MTGLLVSACSGTVGESPGVDPTAGTAGRNTGTGAGAGTGSPAGQGSAAGTGAGAGSGTGVGTGTNTGPRDVGQVTIRRLNRAEYDRTVHSLLGTNQTLGATLFPDDSPQVGFDNNGDLQTLSPVQFALYQQAAETLAAEAMAQPAPGRLNLLSCAPSSGAACLRTLIVNFGLRAFRRPLTDSEITNFVSLTATAAQAGATADEQFRTVMEAMLISPHFLYRPEYDPDPSSTTAHALSPYETASRLSYMLYRSMPDQALFDAAAAGRLAQPADLVTQLDRMLADPQSAFQETFASSWLGTAVVTTQQFDAKLFPGFTPALAKSMSQEVVAFFSEFVQKNNAVSELLTANYSYLDKNLATLYGVAGVSATTPVRTTLTTPQRSGLLTMGGVLAATSYPTRTSVVKRGEWVLGQLLCAPPPPPPPDVPPFPSGAITASTQKEVLAQHRASPSCATCHDSLDNIGIAMENYDAIGTYRTQENGTPIDATGKFAGPIADPDMKGRPPFTGAVQLAAAVAADPRFAACVAQKVLSYALGRDVTPEDPYLSTVTTAPSTGRLGVRDILVNVVTSDPFRMHRGDASTATGAKP